MKTSRPRAKPVLILGTGGNCIDILDTLRDINDAAPKPVYECVGFLDDDPKKIGKILHGVKVLGPLADAKKHPKARLINGIGNPDNFWKKPDILAKTGAGPDRFETILHPTASVSKMAQLGRGVVVFQNAVITSNVTIGNHVIILPNSVISHDDVIGDYTCIAGGVCVSGGVTIGPCCYLGTNSCVIGNAKIGKNCLIGMGSVVLQDVPNNSVVVGNPARLLRRTRS